MLLFKSARKIVAFDLYFYIFRQKSGRFSYDNVHLHREIRIYQSEALLFYFKFVVTSKVTACPETIRKCINVSFIGRTMIRNVDHLYLRTSLT